MPNTRRHFLKNAAALAATAALGPQLVAQAWAEKPFETNYSRMFGIIRAAGFRGIVGIEYEGNKLSEEDGIRQTKALLEKIGRV